MKKTMKGNRLDKATSQTEGTPESLVAVIGARQEGDADFEEQTGFEIPSAILPPYRRVIE